MNRDRALSAQVKTDSGIHRGLSNLVWKDIQMMMKVRYIKVLRETYNIRTRCLRYRGGFDLEESAEGAVLANDSM